MSSCGIYTPNARDCRLIHRRRTARYDVPRVLLLLLLLYVDLPTRDTHTPVYKKRQLMLADYTCVCNNVNDAHISVARARVYKIRNTCVCVCVLNNYYTTRDTVSKTGSSPIFARTSVTIRVICARKPRALAHYRTICSRARVIHQIRTYGNNNDPYLFSRGRRLFSISKYGARFFPNPSPPLEKKK